MALASDLYAKVQAVCPSVIGIRIGDPGDKTTWGFDAPGASGAEVAAAQSVIDGYSVATYNARAQDERDVAAALLKVLFNHENRIRALEGKAAITRAQFVAGVKSLADPT